MKTKTILFLFMVCYTIPFIGCSQQKESTSLKIKSNMKKLTPEEERVIIHKGTEMPFTGEYTDLFKEGVYVCKQCGSELYKSDSKFHSGCGWPSFYAPTDNDAVILLEDRSLAPRIRTEVRCAACDSHLGHVFEGEGFDTPTDQRWCINSVSLILEPK